MVKEFLYLLINHFLLVTTRSSHTPSVALFIDILHSMDGSFIMVKFVSDLKIVSLRALCLSVTGPN